MRRKWILITVAVLIQAVLLVGCSKTKTPEITSIEQLNDKAYSVGVGEGAAGMFAVEEYLPEAEMLLYSSDVTGYAAVRQGELDAYAYDRIMMEFAIAGGVEGVRLLEGSLGETMDIAVGISPKTEIPNLTQKVNQFLRELRDEGTLDDMYRRWVTMADDHGGGQQSDTVLCVWQYLQYDPQRQSFHSAASLQAAAHYAVGPCARLCSLSATGLYP